MSSDEYSDFSEIDSEDNDYQPTKKKQRTGSGKAKDKEYKIRHALKPPRATTYTTQSLFDQIFSGDIDLDPEYQRDVVWPEAKQIGLIDSIFRNFYIPPVIFSVIAHEDGSESRICIDGKQRLTSIYRFMDGLIYHRDRATSQKYYYKDSPSAGSKVKRKKQLLPEKYRRLFANKQIVCIEYADINDKDEREIFQRVQLGMALTPAEKLAVLKTPRADFIRSIQVTHFKDSQTSVLGSNTVLDWDRTRGTDFRCLATACWCIDRWMSDPTFPGSPAATFSQARSSSLKKKKAASNAPLTNMGTILQLETWLSDTVSVDPFFRQTLEQTFRVLADMVLDQHINSCFRLPGAGTGVTKIAPVEFIAICILIAVWRSQLSLKGLSRAIRAMRKSVRRTHDDIRMNNKVAKDLLEFVRGIQAEQYENVDQDEEDDVVGVKAGTKRKRVKDDNEEKQKVPEDQDREPPMPAPSELSSGSTQHPATQQPATPKLPSRSQKQAPSQDRLASIRAVKAAHQQRLTNASNTASNTVDTSTVNDVDMGNAAKSPLRPMTPVSPMSPGKL